MSEKSEQDIITQAEHEKQGHVDIWWFPQHFSQSRMGNRGTGSNACTLIALLIAQRCYDEDIKMTTVDTAVIKAFANSIIEGNEIHEQLLYKGALHDINMSVPEAIEAAGYKMRFLAEWKSLVYLMDLGESLYEQLLETVTEWYNNPPPRKGSDLYVILIADSRSVLLVFQKEINKVTLLDSHQHHSHGAVIAQVTTSCLQSLCSWYHRLLIHYYGSRPECYELSFLYFKRYEAGEMAGS